MKPPILILFGSVTGNAEYCAEKAAREARDRGFDPKIENMAEIDAEVLGSSETLLIITSTYGEGDPPDGAEDLYESVVKQGGQDLSHVRYSVLALGDTAYEHFCKCGVDYDEALEKQGAKRFYPLVSCDTDYDTPCEEWIAGVFTALSADSAVSA